MNKKGKIIPNGVSLEKHENDTVVFFTNLGFDIELIPPSNIPKAKTPDFNMNGKAWEMKSPSGKGRSVIEHAFKRAAKQSENIVFDLRRVNIPTKRAITEINRYLKASKRVKRIKIITRERELIDLNK